MKFAKYIQKYTMYLGEKELERKCFYIFTILSGVVLNLGVGPGSGLVDISAEYGRYYPARRPCGAAQYTIPVFGSQSRTPAPKKRNVSICTKGTVMSF